MTKLARAEVVLGANDRELRSALGRAQSSMKSAGRRLGRIATRAAQAIGAALAAAGAAAIKFASDFEREMTKVNTLVGLSQERVAQMNSEVLRMSAEVGRAPTELARGLFRLTSGGERGANVMESLGTASRAAAIGMGETGNLTRIATSAAQAFSGAGSSVSDVLNTMTKVVREGNVQVNRLQASLGQVQATAADAGLSFQDVGGFLATASRVMGDTQKAARGLRQFLARLAKPTTEMQEAFRDAGTSVSDFRQRISEEGLAGPLVELVRNARESGVEVANLAGSVRAMTPILATAGSQAEEYLKINERVADFQGTIDEAFATTSTTLSFLINQFKSAGQAVLTAVGQQMFPTVKDFVRFLRDNMPGAIEGVVRAVGQVGVAVIDFAVGMHQFFRDISAKVAGGLGLVGLLFLGPKGVAVAGTITALGARIGRNLARIAFGPESEEARQAQKVVDLANERNSLLTRRLSIQEKLRKGAENEKALRSELEHVNSEIEEVEEQLNGALGTLQRTPDAAQESAAEISTLAGEARSFFQNLAGFELGPIFDPQDDSTDVEASMQGLLGAFGIALPDPEAIAQRMRETVQRGLDIAGRQHVTTRLRIGEDAIGATGEDIGKIPGLGAAAGIGEDLGEDITDSMEETLKRGARSAMESLLRGLMEGRDNILDAVLDVGISIASALATEGIMSELGIDSPSRVGIEIGENVGRSIGRGIANVRDRTSQVGRQFVRAVTSDMGSAVRSPSTAGIRSRMPAGGGGAAAGNIRSRVEVTINAVDAKSVRRLVEENEGVFAEPAIRAMNESVSARRAAFGG